MGASVSQLYPAQPVQPGYIAGRWYHVFPGFLAAGAAIPANSVRLLPFMLTQSITVSDLGARVTTLAAGGNVRVGVYNSDPTTKVPTTVAAETGNLSTASATVVNGAVSGGNKLFQPGLFWAAVIADGTAGGTVVMQSVNGSWVQAGLLVGSTTQANIASSSTAASLFLTFASTFGAFPDLTGQSLTEVAGSSTTCIVQLKAA